MRRTLHQNPGFTLIELLIVVAIIAILAAIAVPNFLEAQTRAKVSRSWSDMRSMATALEAYRIDYNAYPYDMGSGRVAPRHFYASPFLGLEVLTTPSAYITSVPKDPFIPNTESFPETFVYYCENMEIPFGPYANRVIWQLSGFGPDMDADFNFLVYDATNGTVSNGDIFFWGPGIGTGR